MRELFKNKLFKIILVTVIILLFGVLLHIISSNRVSDYEEFYPDITFLTSYGEYRDFVDYHNYEISELDSYDFDKNNYVVVVYDYDECSSYVDDFSTNVSGDTLNVYFDIHSGCGVCAINYVAKIVEVSKNIKDVRSFQRNVSADKCNYDMYHVDKPMIYIYPEEDMDLTVKLGNEEALSYTYPKYDKEWNLHVSKDGNIYDYKTNRNYYALYWEGIIKGDLDMKEGFVVKVSDTVEFLEEKLELLGLNEREINEFIVYWINKIEDNNYNYIYFKTTDEINSYMPLEFSKNPDTLIRVMVDIKSLDKKIVVKSQELKKVVRSGFTIVEWGAAYYD